MPANYVLLEKITVGAAGAANVTFSNIPQTGYTDLVVKMTTRSDQVNNGYTAIRFNGASTNYSQKFLQGNDTYTASYGGLSSLLYVLGASTSYASIWDNTEMYIPNYTGSSYKSVSTDTTLNQGSISNSYSMLTAGLWSDTAAITSITLYAVSAQVAFIRTFQQHSTFYLYGVAKLGTTPAIVPYATGGDTIMTDGTYWYHTFVSSGTFTPTKALTTDYLVVAGGGGSGYVGGGGGAGGLRSTVTATGGGGSLESALSLASGTGYTVTIGAGGAGSTGLGSSGNNSVFSTITSTAGGRGSALGAGYWDGATGGSGGGGNDSTSASGGAGTANQGYRGGYATSNNAGGGGGGASAVGGNSAGNIGGIGANGVATSISGSSVTYAGGGGGGGNGGNAGGAGGSGGGGAGGSAAGTSGTANTGGGGGGAGSATLGGSGGSGIVIVRYAV